MARRDRKLGGWGGRRRPERMRRRYGWRPCRDGRQGVGGHGRRARRHPRRVVLSWRWLRIALRGDLASIPEESRRPMRPRDAHVTGWRQIAALVGLIAALCLVFDMGR